MLLAEVLEARDHYAALGLPCDPLLDVATIRKSYRQCALRFHPDKDPSPLAARAFQQINQAWLTLSDPTKRCKYHDNKLRESSSPKPTCSSPPPYRSQSRGRNARGRRERLQSRGNMRVARFRKAAQARSFQSDEAAAQQQKRREKVKEELIDHKATDRAKMRLARQIINAKASMLSAPFMGPLKTKYVDPFTRVPRSPRSPPPRPSTTRSQPSPRERPSTTRSQPSPRERPSTTRSQPPPRRTTTGRAQSSYRSARPTARFSARPPKSSSRGRPRSSVHGAKPRPRCGTTPLGPS